MERILPNFPSNPLFLSPLLTERVQVRNLFGEANIFDFEILSAFWLTQQRHLLGKRVHLSGAGPSRRRGVAVDREPAVGRFCRPGVALERGLIRDPAIASRRSPVDCRGGELFQPEPSTSRSLAPVAEQKVSHFRRDRVRLVTNLQIRPLTE
jgi:hypothetical protein